MGRFSSHDHAPETYAGPALAPAMGHVRSSEAKAEGQFGVRRGRPATAALPPLYTRR